MKKTCSKCLLEQESSEFFKNSKHKDGLQSHCKTCQKDHKKKHYEDNKTHYFKKNSQWKSRRQQLIETIKADNGCCLCREATACCLEFHHTDPEQKRLLYCSFYEYQLG